MLNFEKNIDKLIYLIQESNNCDDFLALTGERCNRVSCYECAEIFKKWLSTAGGGTSWTTDEIENWNFAELPKER